MKYRVKEDTAILIPNTTHKNFTASGETLEAGTIVEGEPKIVEGLRAGKPFRYKIFNTSNDQIIHLNKVEPMEKTEVTLGADSQTSSTVVNVAPSKAAKYPYYGAAAGAIAGFAYCKYKKHDHKRTIVYALAGGAIGYIVGAYIEGHKTIKITPSK